MRSVETSAKTRQDAIQTALQELGAELHEVQIEILDEGSRGLFGLGARDVKVRVTSETAVAPAAKPQRAKRQEQRPRKERTQKRAQAPRAEKPERGQRAAKDERPARDESARDESPRDVFPPMTEDEQNEAAALLGEVVAKMGMKATVSAKPADNGGVWLNIESEDSAILIGRRGRTREALQFLINRMFQGGEIPTARDRIIVDVEGYLGRRRESLEDLARNMARRVKEDGRKLRLKPLKPQERRIVHVTLQDDPDVRTYSVGDSENRSVVIAPKDGAQEGERGRGQRSRGPRRRRRPRGAQPERPRAESRDEGARGESQDA